MACTRVDCSRVRNPPLTSPRRGMRRAAGGQKRRGGPPRPTPIRNRGRANGTAARDGRYYTAMRATIAKRKGCHGNVSRGVSSDSAPNVALRPGIWRGRVFASLRLRRTRLPTLHDGRGAESDETCEAETGAQRRGRHARRASPTNGSTLVERRYSCGPRHSRIGETHP
jgi:hypothetical protein